jgi:hypothetical protein
MQEPSLSVHASPAAPKKFCRSPEDFEDVAADWLRYWGFEDVRRCAKGPDGGIDVESSKAIAQVKAWMVPVGRPEIQQLRGAAFDGRKPIFFSLMSYTAEAEAFASSAGVALFRFAGYDGQIEPVNAYAQAILGECRQTSPDPKRMALVSLVETELKELVQTQFGALVVKVPRTENRYVQFSVARPGGIYGECASNAVLNEKERLSSVEINALRRLGWTAIRSNFLWTPSGTTNFWQAWPDPVEIPALADRVVETLRIYGATTIEVERIDY